MPNKFEGALVRNVDNGTEFYTIDQQRIAMVDVLLHEHLLDGSAYINIPRIAKTIHKIKDEDLIIEMDEKQTVITTDTQEFTHTNFTLQAAPSQYTGKIVPKHHLLIPIMDLDKFLRMAKQIKDSFSIRATPSGLTMYTEKDEDNNVKLYMPLDMIYDTNVEEDVKSTYPTEWVYEFIRHTDADRIWIYFDTNFPLKLNFKNDLVESSMMVAPRVDAGA